MTVLFDCKSCGLEKEPVQVPDRQEGEHIGDWMRKVQYEVGQAHRGRSPRCTSQECDLRIPAPTGGEGVGMRPRDPGATE